jgi:tryptophanyl-tRNA synthetase
MIYFMVHRILSGMRPTGRLHIGHMVGALDNWIELQSKYGSYFFVADWHAMTTELNTKDIRENALEMVKDWLAAGIDPNKSTIFVQSLVPQHAELHLIFSMLNTLPRLERMPTFKGQLKNLEGVIDPDKELTQEQIERARSNVSYGFLGYPVLQAADILIYKADGVPVGEDQIPHIELTREIARTFNNAFGKVFPEPEALLTNTPRILGTDGRKMSKSYGNAISPEDSAEVVNEKIKTMITDPQRKRRSDPGDPNVCPVYDFHRAYTRFDKQMEIYKACRVAEIGCIECKKEAANNILNKYDAFRNARAELDADSKKVVEILMDGSARARDVASQTLKEVREHLQLDYSVK